MLDAFALLLALLIGYALVRCQPNEATSLGLTVTLPFAPIRSLRGFAMDMKITQTALLTIAPTDAAGHPASVSGIVWAAYRKDTVEATGTMTPAADGLTATFTPAATGAVTFRVSASNDAGDTLTDVADVGVTAGVAVTLGLVVQVRDAA